MADAPTLDIDHLRTWIGREEIASDRVTEDLARKFHATLALPGAAPRDGEIAPRLIHFCLAQPAVPLAGLGPDGHPARGGFLPPVALPRRMWAGSAFTFHGDIRVGDAVGRHSRIADVVLKTGRSGALCFVAVDHRIFAAGRLALEERQEIVYRADGSAPAATPEPAPQGQWSRPLDTATTTLFRYSALTFNGHRIHYDRRYAIEQEGYAGLVVHGPLQATVLLHLAADIRAKPPVRFRFRAQSLLIDDDRCHAYAAEAEGGLRLWTAREGGPVAVLAEATW